jgi:hypothetical protein
MCKYSLHQVYNALNQPALNYVYKLKVLLHLCKTILSIRITNASSGVTNRCLYSLEIFLGKTEP